MGARVAAVWLHGAGMGPDMWDPARAQGLLAELPGHGARPRAAAPSVAAMAEALLPDLPARFDLIGHSLGGMIGLHLAAHHPGRVRRLVVVDSFLRLESSAVHRAVLRAAQRLVAEVPREGLVALMGMAEYGTARRLARAAGARVDRNGVNDALAAAIAFDGRGLLARIEAPVLVVVGRRNLFSHGQGRMMARATRRGRFEMLPGGHLLPLDDPGTFYARVGAFLAEAG